MAGQQNLVLIYKSEFNRGFLVFSIGQNSMLMGRCPLLEIEIVQPRTDNAVVC